MDKKQISVFLASPSDVVAERELIAEAVREISGKQEFTGKLEVRLLRWEDMPPGVHSNGPQALIDDWADIESCGCLVAVLWRRFGEPMPSSTRTPTEHEIRLAWDRSINNKGIPRVFVYVSDQGHHYSTREDCEQRIAVLKFRDELRTTGIVPSFKSCDELCKKFGVHFENWLREQVENGEGASENVSAQTRALTLNTTVPNCRLTGLSDRVGDLVVSDPRRVIGSSLDGVLVNVRVSLNVNITQDPYQDPHGGWLELSSGKRIRGVLTANNSVTFREVPILISSDSNGHWFRILGLRANSSQLGIDRGEISALVSITAPTALSLNPNVAPVGVARAGWTLAVGSEPGASRGDTSTWSIRFRERQAGSFRSKLDEWSSTHGTRFLMRLFDVPDQVKVLVSPEAVDMAGRVVGAMVWDVDACGGGGKPLCRDRSVEMAELRVDGGFTWAVWEFLGNDRSRVEQLEVALTVCFKQNDGSELPKLGGVRVRASLAPISTVTVAATDQPVPRFLDLGQESYFLNTDPRQA